MRGFMESRLLMEFCVVNVTLTEESLNSFVIYLFSLPM